jgi:YopX protein
MQKLQHTKNTRNGGQGVREIKYRLWDTSKKQMQEQINHFIYLDGKVASFDENRKISETVEHENIIPLKYTGLKDKNGKEIYEGDALSRMEPLCYDSIISNYWIKNINAKVIGNNYENTKLLLNN